MTTQDQTSSLLQMLSFRRPSGSKTERRFLDLFLKPLQLDHDQYGNLYKRIGKAPIVAWSCHTDTVHRQGGTQKILHGASRLVVKDKGSNCLGADDGAGVWLMSQMIQRQIPGLYLFHRDEEIGAMGSSWIAQNTPEIFHGIECAIALDRRGFDSVITHQMTRCCSDDFARSLAHELGGEYRPDDTGLFTDTANYTDLVGECTNLSVGYDREHSNLETLDLQFLFELLEKLCALKIDKLVFSRQPGETDYHDTDDWFREPAYVQRGWDWDSDPNNPANDSVARVIQDNPHVIAALLESYGVSEDELYQAIYDATGRVPHA